MTTTPAHRSTLDHPRVPCVDELDGRPVWGVREGDRLHPDLPGLLAVARLGVGHRCETWVAWSRDLWHPVVVKLARPDQVTHPRAVATLRREVRALGGAGHPAYPRLLHDGSGAVLPHVVVELLDGPSLGGLLDEGERFAEVEAASLTAQLLAALRHLHRRGLAHLDVKADNVLVVNGTPRLVDLGSSRELGVEQPPGHPVGTPGYAAPEMEACAPVSAAMDLYGLGTVLTEALTGEPFELEPTPPDTAAGAVARRLLADDPAVRGTVDLLLVELDDLAGERRPSPVWARP